MLGTEGQFFNDTVWIDPLGIAAGRLTKLTLPDKRDFENLADCRATVWSLVAKVAANSSAPG